jgi:hypothetical protein
MLTSCVGAKTHDTLVPIPPPRENIDTRLQPIVEMFEGLYNIKVNCPVKVGTTQPTKKSKHRAWGYCHSKRGIVISDELMDEDYDAIEEVVMHELGHCIFGREHTTTKIDKGPMRGCATSVMTDDQMLSQNQCWQQFKGYYVKELASPGFCRNDFVFGGVCPTEWNANPQFYHVLGNSRLPMRFYSVPNK